MGAKPQMTELRQLVAGNRLVTLTGAGGAGKTRLAVEVAAQLTTEFADGLWYIDLAPITNPAVAPVTVARTLGLPDQPGRSTMELLVRFFGDKTMLLLLDNCEHLLDACGAMVVELLATCPQLTILTTSREPLGVPGELSWRVPSLSLADEAIELFADRARRARPDFVVSEDNTALVEEICERLDGMPLAIELAAARIRALSLQQILDSLHDRFRLLTGGARTAVRRQQTLRASVDWSHALLTEPEQVLFRRLAVFAGGFDLDAAQAVGASTDIEAISSSICLACWSTSRSSSPTKSMAQCDTACWKQCASTGWKSWASQAKPTTCAPGTATTTPPPRPHCESQAHGRRDAAYRWAEVEIDNLRAAHHVESRDRTTSGSALELVASLHQFWLTRGRFREGLAAFDAVFADELYDTGDIAPAILVRAVADAAILAVWASVPASLERARKGPGCRARTRRSAALIARCLMGCGMLSFLRCRAAYFAEAIELARASGDLSVQCQSSRVSDLRVQCRR